MGDTVYGVNSSSPASPGISGAIKDAVGAIAKYVAPKSITQRSAKVDTTVNDESGDQNVTRLPSHDVDPSGEPGL